MSQAVYSETSKTVLLLTKDRFLNLFKVESDSTELEFVNAIELPSLLESKGEGKVIGLFSQAFYDTIYVLTSDGECLKLNSELEFTKRIKLGDGTSKIVAAVMSPNEEHVVFVSDDGALTLLDKHFEVEKRDQLHGIDSSKAGFDCRVVWRFDSEYFSVIHNQYNGGQAMTYTRSLQKFHTNSLYHPDYDLVRNVFEKPDPSLQPLSSWVPNGALIYGVRKSIVKDKPVTSILAWEKNCLHYKEFQLPEFANEGFAVRKIEFSKDSIVMFVWIVSEDQEKSQVLVYTRSNAEWHFNLNLPIQGKVIEIFTSFNQIQLLQAKQLLSIHYNLSGHTFEYEKNG